MPALAKFIAMPPPMVPAPMTAADLIGRFGVSSGTSGILLAARSPKKAWRSAFDSVVCTSSMNSSRSNFRPSSNFLRDCGGNRLDALQRRRERAGHGFDRVARELQEGFVVRVIDLQVAHLRQRPHVGDLAGERQRARPSGRRRSFRSNSAVLASFSEATGLPETIMFKAISRPTTRGRRWVPPAPGRMPSLTSGSAICAPGSRHAVVAAERQLQAAAHAHRMDRGDHRLGRVFDDLDDGMQRRFGQRLGRIEFLDVGAAGKGLAGAGDHDRLDRIVVQAPCCIALHQRAAGGMTKSIDRRVVERNHGNRTVYLIFGCHISSFFNEIPACGVQLDFCFGTVNYTREKNDRIILGIKNPAGRPVRRIEEALSIVAPSIDLSGAASHCASSRPHTHNRHGRR